MKMGYFSAGSRFSQIVSVFGRSAIGVSFGNLTEGAKYTVFYFTTVDNPALNARSSAVEYLVVVTNKVQVVDLGGVGELRMAIAVVGMLAIILIF
jgi:hypothetical protein